MTPCTNKMTTTNLTDVSEILDQIDASSDPRTRLELTPSLLAAVKAGGLHADDRLLTRFTETVSAWMSHSNHKVASAALDLFEAALDTAGEVYTAYALPASVSLVERLADNKEQVRQKAQSLLVRLNAAPGSNPQVVIDRLCDKAFVHKQWQVRLAAMQIFHTAVTTLSQPLQYNRITPVVCNLVGDANQLVREAASDAIVEVYKRVGEKLERDIVNRQLLPSTKWGTALLDRLRATTSSVDETDRAAVSSTVTPLRTAKPMAGMSKSVYANGKTSAAARPAMPARSLSNASGGGAGAIDEEDFLKAFEKVPSVTVGSIRDVSRCISEVRAVLTNEALDWSKRADALKKIRAIYLAHPSASDFSNELRELIDPLANTIKDLRSQIAREACITVAFIAQRLGPLFEPLIERLLPPLVSLIQSSAKIMASSGYTACLFVLKSCVSQKTIPTLLECQSSKSNQIRTAVAEFFFIILTTWPPNTLQRCATQLQAALKSSINDAAPDCRSFGRKSFVEFSKHFKQQADDLYKSLDRAKQRQVDQELSGGSRTSSQASVNASQENRGVFRVPATPKTLGPPTLSKRSASEIDAAAARNALSMRRQPLQHVNNAPRPPTGRPPSTPTGLRHSPTPTRTGSLRYRTPQSVRSARGASPASSVRQHRRRDVETASVHSAMELQGVDHTASGVCPLLSSCLSGDPKHRRDALAGLQQILSSSPRVQLSGPELTLLIDACNRLFVDPNPTIQTQFLDTLTALVRNYATEQRLHDYLYVLLSRVLTKIGQQPSPAINDKLGIVLETMTSSFPSHLLLSTLMRYLADPAQSPANTVKIALLLYFDNVLAGVQEFEVANNAQYRQVMNKLVLWAQTGANEVPQHAREALLHLFRRNETEFYAALRTFSPDNREVITNIIRTTASSPSPHNANGRASISEPRTQRATSLETGTPLMTNGDAFNLDEIRRSLLETTSSIQKYTSTASSTAQSPTDSLAASGGDASDEIFEHLMDQISIDGGASTAQRHKAIERFRDLVSRRSLQIDERRLKHALMLMVETCFDAQTDTVALALRTLRSLIGAEPQQCSMLTEMLVLKLLEVYEGHHRCKEVVTRVLTTAEAIALNLQPQKVLSVIVPLLQQPPTSANQLVVVIKMTMKLLPRLELAHLQDMMRHLCPVLVANSQFPAEIQLRKASVQCIATLRCLLGPDTLAPYITGLQPGTARLVDVYAERQMAVSSVDGSVTSQH